MLKYIRSFSLIELMVVIAIVGIVSSVSIPTYKNYLLKTKIIEAITPIESVVQKLKEIYSKNGAFETTMEFYDVTVTNNSWTNFDEATSTGLGDKIGAVAYFKAADNLGMVLLVTIKNLTGVPNYVEPISGAGSIVSGSYSSFTIALRDVNGFLLYACGHANDTNFPTNSIPFEYLPSVCSCTHTNTFRLDGTGCSD